MIANPFLASGQMVVVEVDAVEGREPATFALDALVATVEQVSGRSRAVVASGLQPRGSYDRDELVAIHAATYSADPTSWRDRDGAVVLHVLYVDGTYENDDGVEPAGLSITGFPLIVVFRDRFPVSAPMGAPVPTPLEPGYERSILMHEYGHAVGLVGCGLPEVRVRHDPESRCHSAESDSVMYPSMHNSADPATWILDDELQTVWRFSDDDWNDIRAQQARY